MVELRLQVRFWLQIQVIWSSGGRRCGATWWSTTPAWRAEGDNLDKINLNYQPQVQPWDRSPRGGHPNLINQHNQTSAGQDGSWTGQQGPACHRLFCVWIIIVYVDDICQICFVSGHLVQSLTIQPKSNLHNSSNFQTSFVRWCHLMSCCVECLCLAYVIPIVLNEYRHCLWNDFVTFPNIRAFTYTFPCNFSKRGDKLEIYGTGGTMLQNTKNLLRVR